MDKENTQSDIHESIINESPENPDRQEKIQELISMVCVVLDCAVDAEVVITIDQVPVPDSPLAMGNYRNRITVNPMR